MAETDDNLKEFRSVRIRKEWKKEWVYYVINDKQVKRKYVVPNDPQTEAQLARRSKFQNAVSAWQALTPAQKKLWNQQAKYKNLGMSGYNLFISNYMKT